jgi:hypothetical protein
MYMKARLPESASAFIGSAQALLCKLPLCLPLLGFLRNNLTILRGIGAGDVIKGKFGEAGYIFQGKKAELVKVFVCTVRDNSHDTQIWFT